MFNLFWVTISYTLAYSFCDMSDCTFIWGLHGPNRDPLTVGNIFVPFLPLNGTHNFTICTLSVCKRTPTVPFFLTVEHVIPKSYIYRKVTISIKLSVFQALISIIMALRWISEAGLKERFYYAQIIVMLP